MATEPLQQHSLLSLSFTPLHPSNPNILLYKPPNPASPTPSPKAPKLIILATWLGGSTSRRIAIYCRGYQTFYPGVPILLIRTVLADITTKSFSTVQAQLEPARDYLLSLFPPSTSLSHSSYDAQQIDPADGALLHIFSHGGCNSALQLSRLLRSTSRDSSSTPTPFPIPLTGLILDCCPGSPSFLKAYTAATYSLPATQPLNLIGRAILFPCIGTLSTLQALGFVSSVADLRRELNDLDTFGPVPRLYLHSRGDGVVRGEDVVKHAEEIEGKGVTVRREEWAWAPHCALPVEDAGRYWRVVGEFVDSCCGGQAGQKGHAREVKL